jgi:lipoyl-dependent peroxiredoxin
LSIYSVQHRRINMPKRSARAVWEGSLARGTGRVSLESGLFKGPYSFGSRFRTNAGTNPEELIAAAHAACFSMALSSLLSEDGYQVVSIDTSASVTIEDTEDGPEITAINLQTEAKVEGMEDTAFREYAEKAKAGCPVSKALRAVRKIELEAKLIQ